MSVCNFVFLPATNGGVGDACGAADGSGQQRQRYRAAPRPPQFRQRALARLGQHEQRPRVRNRRIAARFHVLLVFFFLL